MLTSSNELEPIDTSLDDAMDEESAAEDNDSFGIDEVDELDVAILLVVETIVLEVELDIVEYVDDSVGIDVVVELDVALLRVDETVVLKVEFKEGVAMELDIIENVVRGLVAENVVASASLEVKLDALSICKNRFLACKEKAAESRWDLK